MNATASIIFASTLSWLLCTETAWGDCAAPKVLAPARGQTIPDARPRISWEAIPGVTQYHIRLISREPEGGVLSSIDTIVEGTAFAAPRALARGVATVQIVLTPVCSTGSAPAARPRTEHRFYVDVRGTCKLPGVPTMTVTPDNKRVTWRKAAMADRYDLYGYDANSGVLLFARETRESEIALPDTHGTPVALTVRPRCGEVIGAPAYLLY